MSFAGIVCECAWDRDDPMDIDWYERDVMSETDWQLADLEPGFSRPLLDAVERVYALVNPEGGPLWSAVRWEARGLIEASRESLAA